jgi:hypothetical protein
MKSRSETRTTPQGASVEIGTVEFEGLEYAALGSIVDTSNGYLAGYVQAAPGEQDRGIARLCTWEGVEICKLRSVATWQLSGREGQARRSAFYTTMTAYRATHCGKVYSGRGLGPGMLLRLRAGRRVES